MSEKEHPSAEPQDSDASQIHGKDLVRYYQRQGNSFEAAQDLASQELSRRLHAAYEQRIKDVGMTKEQYDAVFEKYGYQRAGELLGIIHKGQAHTPEEALQVLFKQWDEEDRGRPIFKKRLPSTKKPRGKPITPKK